MRTPRALSVVRWIAVLPAAAISGGAAGIAVAALYSIIPGEVGKTWQAAGPLPANAGPASAVLCLIAAVVALFVGREVAPSHRLQAAVALSALLSVGVVLQATEAVVHLRSGSSGARDTNMVSLWETAGFAFAIVLFLSIAYRRRTRVAR
jgi:hypothetical protein